ncbi:DUF4253 domain-containing protein [Kitasatospora sp. NPDC056138]|uniref:DUF4253 domain-containing protein n=1 Tax=Kitasatospora sp. NPDC056138 TaxID=3345724 RepID=UPI0035E167AF
MTVRPAPLHFEGDVARCCAVLRSREDRFGVRLVVPSFDQPVLSVGAPPRTIEEAPAVAARRFASRPDDVRQGHGGTRVRRAARAGPPPPDGAATGRRVGLDGRKAAEVFLGGLPAAVGSGPGQCCCRCSAWPGRIRSGLLPMVPLLSS